MPTEKFYFLADVLQEEIGHILQEAHRVLRNAIPEIAISFESVLRNVHAGLFDRRAELPKTVVQ